MTQTKKFSDRGIVDPTQAAFIGKPFAADALLRQVRQVLDAQPTTGRPRQRALSPARSGGRVAKGVRHGGGRADLARQVTVAGTGP